MGYKKIEKKSIRYSLLSAYARLVNRYYYKEIKVAGRENIPEKGPVIFVANHQNALMDALAIILSIRVQPVFLARADIFKSKIVAELLYLIKILPIYRIRDGVGNLGKNEDVFKKTFEILENKRYLAMFPEGNHAGFRRLRMLQKGVSRIAFMVESKNDFKLGLQIVPVGIDYSSYSDIRGTLFVNFGKPFNIEAFKELYVENEQKAMNALRNLIREKIREQMIDIRSEDHYNLIMDLRDISRSNIRKRLKLTDQGLVGKHQADKWLTERLNQISEENTDKLNELQEIVTEYKNGLGTLGLRDWLFEKKSYSKTGLVFRAIVLLLMFPFALYGLVLNYLPYGLAERVAKKIKDPQFKSSFKWALALFIYPVYYAVLMIAFSFISEFFWVRLAFFISLPVLGMFTFSFNNMFKKWLLKLKYQYTGKAKSKEIKRLAGLRKQINEKLINLLRLN